jgi:hypothetical protein
LASAKNETQASRVPKKLGKQAGLTSDFICVCQKTLCRIHFLWNLVKTLFAKCFLCAECFLTLSEFIVCRVKCTQQKSRALGKQPVSTCVFLDISEVMIWFSEFNIKILLGAKIGLCCQYILSLYSQC